MAKLKVRELAEELNISNDDVKSFLASKGVEVKRSDSSLDEEAVAAVRANFKKAEAPKAESKPEAPKAEVKPQPKAESKPEAAKPEAKTEEAPKKKKNIIFVSNPHNSNMAGKRNQGGNGNATGNAQNRNNNGGGRQQGYGNDRGSVRGSRVTQTAQTYRPLPKPVIKPVAITPTPKPQPANQQPKPKTEVRQQEQQVQTNQQQADNRSRNNQTGATQNTERRAYNNNGDGQKRYGDRRPQNGGSGANGQRNDRDRNGGYNRGNQGNGNAQNRQGGNRPFAGNDRPNRGDGRPQNRFGKNQPGKGYVPEAPMNEPEKHRDDEKRRMSQERDKRSKKDHIYEDDNAAMLKNKNKAGRFIKPEKKEEVVEEQIKVITIPETITIKDLADKMKLQPSAIVKKLFMQGQIVTVNQEVDFETAENIAIDYDIICEKEVQVDVIEELLKEDDEDEKDMVKRPPVICVMGHVDHGKTSLLDAIRSTRVTDREAGGITQHIGASVVSINGQKITFLDTPGHEAFTAMRMRGANSTDIAILVVAADDGVMPQTIEAINHAKAAGVEIIVAVNKIDKPSANIEKVKQELSEYELIPEDWGGSTIFVPVSAHTHEGIDQLLEMLLLTAEVSELKANPKRKARGVIIEAQLDKGRGAVATVLVQKGTLTVGEPIACGSAYGKVRAMIDDKGRRVKEAGPSMPVEILGLSSVPDAGETFVACDSEKDARNFAETYISEGKAKLLEETRSRMSLDDLFSQIQSGDVKELDIIVKADVQGSVEAVKQSLVKLSNDEVVVKIIHGGVGAINESDVTLASASNAIIIGFNVRPDPTAKVTAENEGVDIRLYKVIYNAIEDVEAAMKGMLDPVYEEKVIGHAEVRQIFKASGVGNIAGSYVLDGNFERGCKVRITREGTQIFEGNLASLKRFKDDVKEVKAGYECGLVFEGFNDIAELDQVEAYKMVEVAR